MNQKNLLMGKWEAPVCKNSQPHVTLYFLPPPLPLTLADGNKLIFKKTIKTKIGLPYLHLVVG